MCPEFQPSALSPQPSALSPQPSARSSKLFVNSYFLLNQSLKLLSFSWLLIYSQYALSSDNYFTSSVPGYASSADAACKLALIQTLAAPTPENIALDGRIVSAYAIFPPYESNSTSEAGYCGGTVDYAIGTNYILLLACGNSSPRCIYSAGTYATWFHIKNSIELSLTATSQTPPDPRPKGAEGKDGKSTLDLIAKVTEGGSPKAGVVVGFGIAAEPKSGGHAHGNLGSIQRPKGKLSLSTDANGVSITSSTTDANGEIKLRFTADQPAGLHAIVADCTPAGCAATATQVVKVKVPDLIHIPPDYGSTPPRYVLIGNYKPVGGATEQINHNDTHFLTEQSWANLKDLIKTFARLGWGQVGVNDASLEWGGMFDIEGRWLEPVWRQKLGKSTSGGHAEHREGEQVDLSFVRPASVSDALRQAAYDEICEAQGAELPKILWHKNDGYAPHFHVYLTGKVPPSAKAKVCKPT